MADNQRDCPYCNGVGSVGSPGAACPTCGGTGQKPQWLRDLRVGISERSIPPTSNTKIYAWTPSRMEERGGLVEYDHWAACGEYVKLEDYERLTRERDVWAAKWHKVRAELAELKYPGMTGIVRPLSGDPTSPSETADDPLEHSKVILDEILAERGRQVTRLGWTPQHDDEHDDRSLARAAATYVLHYTHRAVFAKSDPSAYQEEAGAMDAACWPDGWEFKPKSPHRDLIRAAALIVAELERLDRSSSQKADDGLVKRGGAIDSSEHKR